MPVDVKPPPAWAWRKRAAASILAFCGVAALSSLLPAVSDAKAGTMIVSAFSLAGAVFTNYVAGRVTHDALTTKKDGPP